MTPEQTAGLYECCEQAREEARRSTLAAGASAVDAENDGHIAAANVWNGWAKDLLAKLEALRDGGKDTSALANMAAADFSSTPFGAGDTIRLSGFVFPGTVKFEGVTFGGDADFKECEFYSNANFRGAKFKGRAEFRAAQFRAAADFGGTKVIKGAAEHIQNCEFMKVARFSGATFSAIASFKDATFREYAEFSGAKFFADASFLGTDFIDVDFSRSQFSNTVFTAALFGGATFENARFCGIANFRDAEFTDDGNFRKVIFEEDRDAIFESAKFKSNGYFEGAIFKGDVYLSQASFEAKAAFQDVNFLSSAYFEAAKFFGPASFRLAEFKNFASFEKAHFLSDTDFEAIKGGRAFDLSAVLFERVPNFNQAHFEEAPRLDNINVRTRMIEPFRAAGPNGASRSAWEAAVLGGERLMTYPFRAAEGMYARLFEAPRDVPARWRALKRLAIQGHDTDRELEFHAQEVCSQRFAGDWPVPWPFWRSRVRAGFFRFWFGVLYEFFSNFGRSLAWPFLFWFLAILASAVYFAGQSQSVAGFRQFAIANGYSSIPASYIRAGAAAWVRPAPCFAGERLKMAGGEAVIADGKPVVTFSGLTDTAWESTNATAEAFNLAWHNAFVVLDSGGEGLFRTYGCLYGLERYGDNPVAFVPRDVVRASAIQKFFSGAMIFLFGLALRNMLKMK
jgi:uncharacterized protein YjbI with pentapeptide repeats